MGLPSLSGKWLGFKLFLISYFVNSEHRETPELGFRISGFPREPPARLAALSFLS